MLSFVGLGQASTPSRHKAKPLGWQPRWRLCYDESPALRRGALNGDTEGLWGLGGAPPSDRNNAGAPYFVPCASRQKVNKSDHNPRD